ncbi:MAG: hypothetical protein AAF363_04930 [Bacteroidota bacterium]
MYLKLIYFLTVISLYSGDNIRSALRAYEKGDLKKVEESLLKTIEKEEFAPGANYLFSVLFSDQGYKKYNLDSSYTYINRSIQLYDSIDEKEVEKLARQGITDTTLARQKLKSQRLAFNFAVDENEIEEFNHYLRYYEGSPFTEPAIKKRDSLGFLEARKADTYAAYQSFMEDYPDAESFEKAEKLYQKLLFEDKTSDGKIQSYISFLEEHPGTFHYQEATKEIAAITFSENSVSVFDWFLKNYRKSNESTKAISLLYHRLKGTDELIEFYEKRYIPVDIRDSLIDLDRLNQKQLHPFIENGKYGLMQSSGDVFIKSQFSAVQNDYLCQPIEGEVFMVKSDEGSLLTNRNLKTIYQGEVEAFSDQGAGWLKVKETGKEVLVHKSGDLKLDVSAESIQWLDPFIRFESNGKYGLVSITGKPLVKNEFDSIYAVGPYFIFRKKAKLGFSNSAEIVKAADSKEISISMKYDELELVGENYLLSFRGEQESLFNKDLEPKIRADKHEIYDLGRLWLLKNEEGYKILDQDFNQVFEEHFLKVFYSDSAFTIYKDSSWYYGKVKEPGFLSRYDSVKLLNNNYSLFLNQDSSFIRIGDTIKIEVNQEDKIRIIKSEFRDSPDLLSINDGNKISIYNKKGNRILNGNYSSIKILNDSSFVVERNRLKGISTSSEEMLVPAKYNVIDNYRKSNISLFKRGSFGNYNFSKDQIIQPHYKTRLTPISDTTLIACEDDFCGIIDVYDNVIVPLKYESLEALNDTLVIGGLDSYFEILDWKNDTTLLANFDDYAYFVQDSSYILTEKFLGKGVYSTILGEVIPNSFSEIRNIGSKEEPFFLGEMYIPEASFYIGLYYDANGQLVRKQVIEEEDYDKVFCLE